MGTFKETKKDSPTKTKLKELQQEIKEKNQQISDLQDIVTSLAEGSVTQ